MIPPNSSLVARVFVPNIDPCIARVDGRKLTDISKSFPTMRDLCERHDPAHAIAEAIGKDLGSLASKPLKIKPRCARASIFQAAIYPYLSDDGQRLSKAPDLE